MKLILAWNTGYQDHRKDGNDTLCYGVVTIDDDVHEEYWKVIRQNQKITKLVVTDVLVNIRRL
jgi:hypothetical protein